MGVFDRVARPAIMAASRSDRLRHTAERLSVTRNVVHRFVPGETVDDALNSVAQLRDSKRMVSIDYLGEDTTVVEDAEKTVQAYLALLDALGTRDESAGAAVRPLEVSLKLSALGQALPRDGEKIARDNAHTICERAQRVGAWVTRRRGGPHDDGLDAVDRARPTYRFPMAGYGSAGLPQAHGGRLRGVRRLGRADPVVQGRLRRAGVGGFP